MSPPKCVRWGRALPMSTERTCTRSWQATPARGRRHATSTDIAQSSLDIWLASIVPLFSYPPSAVLTQDHRPLQGTSSRLVSGRNCARTCPVIRRQRPYVGLPLTLPAHLPVPAGFVTHLRVWYWKCMQTCALCAPRWAFCLALFSSVAAALHAALLIRPCWPPAPGVRQ